MVRVKFILISLSMCLLGVTGVNALSDAQDLRDGLTKQPAPTIVYAYAVPGVFDQNNSGYYKKLVELVKEKAGGTFTFEFTSSNRQMRNFDNNTASCIFITNIDKKHQKDHHDRELDKFLVSNVTNLVALKVYSKRGLSPVKSLNDLKNKAVISTPEIIDGMKNDKIVLPRMNLLNVKDSNLVLTMLERGRADYGIVFDIDAATYERESSLDLFPNDKNFNIIQLIEGMICHNTPQNKKLLVKFNAAIADFKKSGKL